MRIIVSIPTSITKPREIALACREYLYGVVAVNRLLIRAAKRRGDPYPDLYESGVKFRAEPWAGELEEFATIEDVYRRGWGDCDDLVGIRCAQLQEQGGAWRKTGIKVYWRPKIKVGARTQNIYHAQVRLPNRDIDDPSRRLGG